MAFSNNDVSIETRFQLNNSNKFKITDNTDYVGTFGIALADVIGALVIKNPLGVPIHTTTLPALDIDLNVQDYIDTIGLPLDANGDIMVGTYTIDYTVRVSGAVDPGDYTKQFLYNYCYEDIVVDLDVQVDQLCSTLTSTDNTPLPVQTTSNTLTHTITPPIGAQNLPVNPKLPQTVSTVVNIYSGITTKTWTASVSNVIELTFPASGTFSEHYIDVTITGNIEKEIRDDLNLCSLKCNMEALTNRYFTDLGTNSINAVKSFNTEIAPALLASWNYQAALQCGNFDEAEAHYNQVLLYTGSNRNCDCDASSDPTLIIPSCVSGGGSGITYVVDACGVNSAITVTGNTVGSTTTYTVCFDDNMWTKLQALTETVITSTDASITITPVLSGYTMTWDLSVASTPATAHIFSGLLSIDLNAASNPPTLGWVANFSTVVGTKLQEPTINNTNSVNPDWSNQANCFYLDGYVNAAGGEYPKPIMQIIEQYNGKDAAIVPCSHVRNLYVEIMEVDTSNNRIYFKIIDKNYGVAINGRTLSELYGKIVISVIINA